MSSRAYVPLNAPKFFFLPSSPGSCLTFAYAVLKNVINRHEARYRGRADKVVLMPTGFHLSSPRNRRRGSVKAPHLTIRFYDTRLRCIGAVEWVNAHNSKVFSYAPASHHRNIWRYRFQAASAFRVRVLPLFHDPATLKPRPDLLTTTHFPISLRTVSLLLLPVFLDTQTILPPLRSKLQAVASHYLVFEYLHPDFLFQLFSVPIFLFCAKVVMTHVILAEIINPSTNNTSTAAFPSSLISRPRAHWTRLGTISSPPGLLELPLLPSSPLTLASHVNPSTPPRALHLIEPRVIFALLVMG
ncbi:hypothetical protein BDZ89DRAFT_1144436 [Hymenopellis radicata]|nr:hypothetical protein BDZ89DRAFT_1144436 [Hymenopellis radicata]